MVKKFNYKMKETKDKTIDMLITEYNISNYQDDREFLKLFFKYGKLESSSDYISRTLKEDKDFIIELIEEVLKQEREGAKIEYEISTRYDILINQLNKPEKYFEDYYPEILKLYKKYNSFFNYFEFSLDKMKILSKGAESFKHSTLKGEARENFVKEFLELILPSNIEYSCGEIVEISGRKSNQLDLILQNKTAPKLKITNNSILAFCLYVLAVIEVKTTLDSNELRKCLNQSKLIKNMCIRENIGIHKENIKDGSAEILGIPHVIFTYKTEISDINNELKTFSSEIDCFGRFEKIDFLSDLIILVDKNECWRKINNEITSTVEFKKVESDNVLIELFLFLNHIFNKKADIFNNNIRYLPVYFGKDKLP